MRVLDWIGPGFRLPTEAEWEYACRAGSKTQYFFGDDEAALRDYAWISFNCSEMHAVGEKKPNAFGLYDMQGNVSEWCWDWRDDGYYKQPPTDDPRGPDEPTASTTLVLGEHARVFRGGCYGWGPEEMRSASRHAMGHRGGYNNDGRNKGVGFRVDRAQSSR